MTNPRFGEITDGGEHISKEIWDIVVAGLFDGDNYPIHLIVRPRVIFENGISRETYEGPTLYIIDNYLNGYQLDTHQSLSPFRIAKHLTIKLSENEITYIKSLPCNWEEWFKLFAAWSSIVEMISCLRIKISDERINKLQSRIDELEKMNQGKSDIIQHIVETFKAIQSKQEEENKFIKYLKQLFVWS